MYVTQVVITKYKRNFVFLIIINDYAIYLCTEQLIFLRSLAALIAQRHTSSFIKPCRTLQTHWISVRFNKMGVIPAVRYTNVNIIEHAQIHKSSKKKVKAKQEKTIFLNRPQHT